MPVARLKVHYLMSSPRVLWRFNVPPKIKLRSLHDVTYAAMELLRRLYYLHVSSGPSSAACSASV